MKSGAGDSQHVVDEMVKYLDQKAYIWDFEIIEIGGFGGSVVCDRIVRLVLGGVGFGLLEKTLGGGR